MPTNAQSTHADFGQSIWYDNIRRKDLQDGSFAALVARGVRGCTSNPAIFNKAIGGSSDYDESLKAFAVAGDDAPTIYKKLAVADIQQAADQLRPVFDESKGADGHVSIEVAPGAAHDVQATVSEARELVAAVARDNLMIKVPATEAGLEAIKVLTSEGISVNVTLIFSRQRYVEVAKAYIDGLKLAAAAGRPLDRIASVASFFVSRIDSTVDAWLEKQAASKPQLAELAGRIAIANAKLAYAEFEKLFGGADFQELRGKGARPQRLLWASTGTKNPKYPDTLYVDELIGKETVNTVPPATLDAFLDHGHPSPALHSGWDQAAANLAALSAAGLDLESVCSDLLRDGLKAFVDAMDELVASVETRRKAFAA